MVLNMTDNEWKLQAKNMIKGVLAIKGISYEMLVTKLNAIGVQENYNSVNTKLNRGSFTFVFAIQCFKAIGLKSLSLDELNSLE